MLFYNCCRFLARIYLWIYLDVHYINIDNINQSGSFIICSNHISNFDSIAIALKFKKKIVFLGKSELFKYRLSAWFFRKLGVIPVDRGNSNENLINDCSFVLKNNGILGIFPEGTRSKNGELNRFKSGIIHIAYLSKADILPVAIKVKNNKINFRAKYFIKFGELIKFETIGIDDEDKRSFVLARRLLKENIENLLAYIEI